MVEGEERQIEEGVKSISVQWVTEIKERFQRISRIEKADEILYISDYNFKVQEGAEGMGEEGQL